MCRGSGVLARFYRPGGGGFELFLCPGRGWSGLELTDTLHGAGIGTKYLQTVSAFVTIVFRLILTISLILTKAWVNLDFETMITEIK